jgi:hypothetical protein
VASQWTVTSAARYARQARNETAAHMETAGIARELRKYKLRRAYEVHATNLRNREAARVMLFGGLGYVPPYPDDWAEAAELLTRDDAQYLATADLYVITPQMCDVVSLPLRVSPLKIFSSWLRTTCRARPVSSCCRIRCWFGASAGTSETTVHSVAHSGDLRRPRSRCGRRHRCPAGGKSLGVSRHAWARASGLVP